MGGKVTAHTSTSKRSSARIYISVKYSLKCYNIPDRNDIVSTYCFTDYNGSV